MHPAALCSQNGPTMARTKTANSDDERKLKIIRDPLYKQWSAALKAFDRALVKRSRNELEQPKVWKARDKASELRHWLRELPFTPEELLEENQRYATLLGRIDQAEAGAAAAREAYRAAQLRELDEQERNSPVRYDSTIGEFVQGRRVLNGR